MAFKKEMSENYLLLDSHWPSLLMVPSLSGLGISCLSLPTNHSANQPYSTLPPCQPPVNAISAFNSQLLPLTLSKQDGAERIKQTVNKESVVEINPLPLGVRLDQALLLTGRLPGRRFCWDSSKRWCFRRELLLSMAAHNRQPRSVGLCTSVPLLQIHAAHRH